MTGVKDAAGAEGNGLAITQVLTGELPVLGVGFGFRATRFS